MIVFFLLLDFYIFGVYVCVCVCACMRACVCVCVPSLFYIVKTSCPDCKISTLLCYFPFQLLLHIHMWALVCGFVCQTGCPRVRLYFSERRSEVFVWEFVGGCVGVCVGVCMCVCVC